MLATICCTILGASRCGRLFMLLYMHFIVLGVLAAQQHVLEASESLAILSNNRDGDRDFVSNV
jgi:hypothetical protein